MKDWVISFGIDFMVAALAGFATVAIYGVTWIVAWAYDASRAYINREDMDYVLSYNRWQASFIGFHSLDEDMVIGAYVISYFVPMILVVAWFLWPITLTAFLWIVTAVYLRHRKDKKNV